MSEFKHTDWSVS